MLKIVNTRLHLSLGSDPVPEEPPTEDSNAGEEEGEESAAGGGESKKPQDSNCECAKRKRLFSWLKLEV